MTFFNDLSLPLVAKYTETAAITKYETVYRSQCVVSVTQSIPTPSVELGFKHTVLHKALTVSFEIGSVPIGPPSGL